MIVASTVLVSARGYGLTEDTETLVAKMAALATPLAHPEGNARFEDFLFRIEPGLIAHMRRFSGLDIIYDPLPPKQLAGLVSLLG